MPDSPGLSVSPVIALRRPVPCLFETWQEIDASVWSVTDPLTGTPWTPIALNNNIWGAAVPAASENCRIRTRQWWNFLPGLYSTAYIYRKLILEFEFMLSAGGQPLGNIDQTVTFLGFSATAAAIRTTNNIAGFYLQGNALSTVTDRGGSETLFTGFGETLTNQNKLKIEASLGHVRFYLNDTFISDDVTNLPDSQMVGNFYLATNVGGAMTVFLGGLRIWYED